MVRRLKSGGYRLYSRKRNPSTRKRRNLGTFRTLAAAKRHEASGALFQAKKLITRATRRRWSAEVTRHSNALDLQKSVFKQRSPRRIALSLKRSAEASRRRKGTPYQSAMSMLNFYINRAGRNLSGKQKRVLVRAKKALPKVFHRG